MEFFHSLHIQKETNGHKSPFVSFQYAEQLQTHSAKSIQTQSKSAPQKGIVIPHKCYITYKPNYVHRRISPHIGQTAYASEEEIVQNSITILIYHNMMYMSRANVDNILYCVSGR